MSLYVICPAEGKAESQDAGGEADKEEANRKKSVGAQSGVHAGEEERRISLFIPSQELTVHSLKTSEL